MFGADVPYDRRLVITPLIDAKQQIGKGSVDLRLGNDFIVMKQTGLIAVDPVRRRELEENIENYQMRQRVEYGMPFYLHPQQFALASTLEYLKFPPELMAYVIGRSSWGRLGLVIATATMVEPEFAGTLTLELANVGSVPIALYPCVRVAQLVLHLVETGSQIGRTVQVISAPATDVLPDRSVAQPDVGQDNVNGKEVSK